MGSWIVDISIWPEAGQAEAPSHGDLLAIAQAAEAAGVTSLSTPLVDGGVVLGWLAPHVRRLGLVTAVSAGREHPYHAARRIASLDHISHGRIAWSAEQGSVDSEFAEVLKALWDSWAEDAVVVDKAKGILVREGGIRHANHQGQKYRVRGPLPVSRSPQGHPLFVLRLREGQAYDGIGADIIVGPHAALGEVRKTAPEARLVASVRPGDLEAALPALLDDPNVGGVSVSWQGVEAALAAIAVLAPHVAPRASAATLRDGLGLSRPEIDLQRFQGAEPFLVTEE